MTRIMRYTVATGHIEPLAVVPEAQASRFLAEQARGDQSDHVTYAEPERSEGS